LGRFHALGRAQKVMRMNIVRTGTLMAAMTGLFLAAGFLLGGQTGMVIAFLIALGMNFYAYWNSDKLVLKMYRAREVDERSEPDLVQMVRRLSHNAQLPMPKVYIADNPQRLCNRTESVACGRLRDNGIAPAPKF
jgi:heat shock protein HtpX